VSCLRGTDSTGIAVAHSKWGGYRAPTFEVIKDTYSSPDFFSLKDVDALITKKNSFAVLGHCRAATYGSVTPENAHPFQFDHIIGAHNGTCTSFNPAKNDPTYKDRSDSFMLFKNLAENGLQDTVDKAGYGAYALVWFNRKSMCLNFLRNSQRPLFLMHSQDNSTLLWASEKVFLDFVVRRAGSSSWQEPVALPTDQHLVIDMLGSKFVGEMSKMEKRTTHSLYKTKYKQGSNEAFLNDEFWENALKEADRAEKEAGIKKETIGPATIVVTRRQLEEEKPHATFLGFNKIAFNLRYILRYLKKGCVTCSKPCNVSETTWWFSKTDYVCDDCMNRKKPFLTYYLKDIPLYSSKIQGDLDKELGIINAEKEMRVH
jgi:hypothetical protein